LSKKTFYVSYAKDYTFSLAPNKIPIFSKLIYFGCTFSAYSFLPLFSQYNHEYIIFQDHHKLDHNQAMTRKTSSPLNEFKNQDREKDSNYEEHMDEKQNLSETDSLMSNNEHMDEKQNLSETDSMKSALLTLSKEDKFVEFGEFIASKLRSYKSEMKREKVMEQIEEIMGELMKEEEDL
ncbi:hypothetical protein C0J52_27239, partial [Blattella germanica]